jgi:hypothetical protein
MSRALEDWIDNYLEYVDNSEPPIMYHLWSSIAVISSVLKRKCWLEWGSLIFYPNMYIVLVGPPAARKGTAMNYARPFLEDLQIKMAAEATTREALIKALLESFSDSSQLDGKMYMHSSLVIWSQELTVFLGHQNFQLMSDLTDWYDCRNQWTYRTKNMGTDDVIGVYVTLFGATTPDLIRSALPLDAIGGGLTSRIVFINESNKRKAVSYPGLSERQKDIQKLLKKDLARIHNLHGKFVVTKEFFTYWSEWYPSQEHNPPFEDTRFAGYLERRANHVMKLSMILNASRTDSMIITLDDLRRAIDILIKTEEKMKNTFSGMGRLPEAEILTKVMNDVGNNKYCLYSEILMKYHNDVDKWRLDKIVESLEAANFLIKVVTDNDIKLLHKKSVQSGIIDIKGRLLNEAN